MLLFETRGANSNTYMMTSSNGNTFRVTGPLCGEFTGHRWIPRTKSQWCGTLMFSLIYAWINGWVNNREAGDLRRHGALYDVNVMYKTRLIPSELLCSCSVITSLLHFLHMRRVFSNSFLSLPLGLRDCRDTLAGHEYNGDISVTKDGATCQRWDHQVWNLQEQTSPLHYSDDIMGAMASQITSPTIVSSTVNLGADQRKHQSSASLPFMRGI